MIGVSDEVITIGSMDEEQRIVEEAQMLAAWAESLAEVEIGSIYDLFEFRDAFDALIDSINMSVVGEPGTLPDGPGRVAQERLLSACENIHRIDARALNSQQARDQCLRYAVGRLGRPVRDEENTPVLLALEMPFYDPTFNQELCLLIEQHTRRERRRHRRRRILLGGPMWLADLLGAVDGVEMVGVVTETGDEATLEIAERLWFEDDQGTYPGLEDAWRAAALLAA